MKDAFTERLSAGVASELNRADRPNDRSTRPHDVEAAITCRLGEAFVVGDERAELVANGEGRGEVERIEAPKSLGLKASGLVQDRVVDREERHVLEPSSRVLGIAGIVVSRAGSDRLYAEKRARGVSIPLRQLEAQGLMPRLTERQL